MPSIQHRVQAILTIHPAQAALTVQLRQDSLVAGPEERQAVLVNVHVGQVRNEVIAHKESHHHPVIYDALDVVSKRKFVLGSTDDESSTIAS